MKEGNAPLWQIVGPLTFLCAYAIAAALPFSTFPYALLLLGMLGLYLSARWHLKGCFYALIFLVVVGLINHIFIENYHFLRLGLEASTACSFFSVALAFENEDLAISHLKSHLASRNSALQNLEEEVVKIRESLVEQQIASTEKIEKLQKELEELQLEKSSLDILNDVLRKTNARYADEKMAIEETVLQNKRRLEEALCHLRETREELNRLNKEEIVLEKNGLMKELNAARCDKEQMRQINETLVRLHASESIKAKEAIDQLHQVTEDKRQIEVLFAAARGDLEQMSQELGQAIEQKIHAEEKTAYLEAAAESREEKERIKELERERGILKEELWLAEKTVQDLVKIDLLYKQLKEQFEEKNKILHETRSHLFKVETELQTMQIAIREEHVLLPETLCSQLDRLDEDMQRVQEENSQLQDLATYLMKSCSVNTPFALHRTPLPAGQSSLEEALREALVPKRKRTVKKPAARQDLLF